MKLILAMDTATKVMGIAVMDLENRTILADITVNRFQNHSQSLVPTIQRCFQELEIAMEDIEIVAVTSGPGSYTGIRIGVTTAKTLSWSWQVPLYSASSLKILAMNGLQFSGIVVPLFDARRGRVYSGIFQAYQGVLEEIVPEQVVSFNEWILEIKKLQQPVLFLGDDVSIYSGQVTEELGALAHFGFPGENIPRASHLANLAYHQWLQKGPYETQDFTPNYLQITEAEANKIKKKCEGGRT